MVTSNHLFSNHWNIAIRFVPQQRKYFMTRTLFQISICLLLLFNFTATLQGHCEIPCGIYGDKARFQQIKEDIKTIEKSMKTITELTTKAANPQSVNQVMRWVTNKEKHANSIRKIATQYFLAQRIKSASPGSKHYPIYLKKLTLVHQIIVLSMKCKQTLDLKFTSKLLTQK